MTLDLHRIQVMERDPHSGNETLVEENPVLIHQNGTIERDDKGRMIGRTTQTVMIQDGHVYWQNGVEIPYEEVPEWVFDAHRKITPKQRRASGFLLPEDITVPKVSPQELLKALSAEERIALLEEIAPEALLNPKRFWTCDDCGEQVQLSRKGLHCAMHARARKKAQQ